MEFCGRRRCGGKLLWTLLHSSWCTAPRAIVSQSGVMCRGLPALLRWFVVSRSEPFRQRDINSVGRHGASHYGNEASPPRSSVGAAGLRGRTSRKKAPSDETHGGAHVSMCDLIASDHTSWLSLAASIEAASESPSCPTGSREFVQGAVVCGGLAS